MAMAEDQPANSLQQPNSTLPQYPEMIMAAVEELSEKNASTRTDISRHIEEAHGAALPPTHNTLLTHYLDKMKQSGQLVLNKNNYMKPDPNAPPRRGRGRPPKPKAPLPAGYVPPPPRPRGRPPKPRDPLSPAAAPMKKAAADSGGSGRKRGRPPKSTTAKAAAPPPPAASGPPRGRGRPPKVNPAVAATVGA